MPLPSSQPPPSSVDSNARPAMRTLRLNVEHALLVTVFTVSIGYLVITNLVEFKRYLTTAPSVTTWAKNPDIIDSITSYRKWVDPQTQRLQRVADTCRKLDPSPPNMSRVYRHLIVDDEHKTLYCYVPKVACTSWKFLLLNLTRGNMTVQDGASEADGTEYRAYRYVHFADDLKTMLDYSQSERELRLNTYFKFIAVRHPLERLVSAYKDKFIKRQMEFLDEAVRIRIHFRPRFSSSKDYVTFEEFIRYALMTGAEDPPRQNSHWARYAELCQPCFVKYDYIAKMETMEFDSQVILRILGLPDRSLPLLHTQHPTVHEDFFRQIRTKYYHRTAELYATDLDMFDYNISGT